MNETQKLYVNFKSVIDRYFTQFQAAYEKANIWPISDSQDGIVILNEEIEEVYKAASILRHEQPMLGDTLNPFEVGNFRGYAVSVILEALQVISVCDKYADTFRIEREFKLEA